MQEKQFEMKHLLTIVFLLTLMTSFGQILYEPQILILAPNETKYEENFEKEVTNCNKEIKKNVNDSEQEQTLNSPHFKNQPENIQQIIQSEIAFSKELDFFKHASFISGQFLAYRFIDKFPNLLIKLKDAKSSGTLDDLKTQSEKEQLQYVLNFASIELYKERRKNYAKITVQLYDNVSNSIILEKTYIGDWTNPGFEFACEEKSINCTLNNALSKALSEIVYIIASNNPTLKKQQQLSQERSGILSTNYLNRTFDQDFLNNVISKTDSSINTSNVFQCLVSEDKTKFVAFFLDQNSNQDFKSLKENKKDKNIHVISNRDKNDQGFLVPQMYAYILSGVLHDKKWYYEKKNVTYFDAENIDKGKQEYFNSLQKWNFFKENSVDFNPEFWETYLFSKTVSSVEENKKEIEELKQLLTQSVDEEEKEVYQEIIDDFYEKDLNNQEYFGLYNIVADQLRDEKIKQNEAFVEKIKKQILNGFYESNSKKNGIERFIKMNGEEYPIIFPSDKSVLLSPIVIDYGSDKLELTYFVLIPNAKDHYDIYQWMFFKPIKPEYSSMYGQEINNQLNEITKWNFSFENLNDKNFWDNYVLLREGDHYKYLKPAN